MIENIKGAIFDMDGTLVDSLMLWDVFWSRISQKYLSKPDFTPSKEIDKAVRTMLLRDAMELIHKKYGMASSGEELLTEVNNISKSFYKDEVELKKGVKELLEYLKQNGIKMCIASATAPDLIEIALEHTGIGDYFIKVISCADIGKGKDEPDVFIKAAEVLGTDIKDTCVFEDSLVALQTAKAAGFRTVGIFDRYNFGQDIIKEIVDEYVDENETVLKLI